MINRATDPIGDILTFAVGRFSAAWFCFVVGYGNIVHCITSRDLANPVFLRILSSSDMFRLSLSVRLRWPSNAKHHIIPQRNLIGRVVPDLLKHPRSSMVG